MKHLLTLARDVAPALLRPRPGGPRPRRGAEPPGGRRVEPGLPVNLDDGSGLPPAAEAPPRAAGRRTQSPRFTTARRSSFVQHYIASRLQRSDYFVAGLYWGLALLLVFPTYVMEYGWARAVVAMSYNVLLDSTAVFLLVFVLLPRFMSRTHVGTTVLLLGAFLLASGVSYHWGYGLILGEARFWSLTNLLGAIIAHGQSYGVFGVLMIGKGYFDSQRRLLLAQKAQAESELKSLRAQIDPHFLFNNLNILYALIQQDQQEASHFLSCFSSLYRYLIRHKDADFVSLDEELRFAGEYIYLLQHRFGEAYCFQQTVHVPAADLADLYVVPGTLQILIENVIKHNRGDEDAPLSVVVEVHPDALTVRNQIAPKRTAVESTGTGLRNLRERYKLLAGREPRIRHHDYFEVSVPVLLPQLH